MKILNKYNFSYDQSVKDCLKLYVEDLHIFQSMFLCCLVWVMYLLRVIFYVEYRLLMKLYHFNKHLFYKILSSYHIT